MLRRAVSRGNLGAFAFAAALASASMASFAAPAPWTDSSPHRERFIAVNGIRLECLDWGGRGPALILLHGLGDNPHVFDDLAGAFTDRFHVIAYARRGHGRSDTKAPYDTATLTEDLRALMDALGIPKANLVGWSMGGNEITTMAVKYPKRVARLVYLDAGYDWSDPDFKAAHDAVPASLSAMPASAMTSLDAYRLYEKTVEFSALEDMGRVEAYLREGLDIQADGSVKPRMSQAVEDALFASLWANPRLDYGSVRSPALAFYAAATFDPRAAGARGADALAWEKQYMNPFREKSIERIRRELANVRIVRVAGTHGSFFLTSRMPVVRTMRRFLGAP